MSIAETLDGHIERIISADSNQVTAEVLVPLKRNQVSYVLDHLEQGHIRTDYFSSHAQHGADQQLIRLDSEDWFSLKTEGMEMFLKYFAQFRKTIPAFFQPLNESEVGLDELLEEGTRVGKLYVENPNLQLSTSEIRWLASKNRREILLPAVRKLRSKLTYDSKILRESVVHPDGTAELPLFQEVLMPDRSILTKENLRRIFDKEIPRRDMWVFKRRQKVGREGIQVPAESGVITLTSLFSGDKDVIVQDATHSDARILTKYTNGLIPIELVPTGEPYTQSSIRVKFYHQPPEPKISVPVSNPVPKKTLDDAVNAVKILSKDEQRYAKKYSIMTVDLETGDKNMHSVVRGDREAYDALETRIKGSKEGVVLISSHFPGGNLGSHILASASKVKRLYFMSPKFGKEFFSDQAHHQLLQMQEEGIDIYWINSFLRKTMRLRGDFTVGKQDEGRYNELRKANKFGALYGSSASVGRGTRVDISRMIAGYRRFHGGNAGVIIGGLGTDKNSAMSVMAEEAMLQDLLVVVCAWNIPYEGPIRKANAFMAFDREYITPRQETFDRNCEALFFQEGGVGTNLEAGIPLVKRKLHIDPNKPMVFVGSYYRKLRQLYQHMVNHGRVKPEVFEHCYWPIAGKYSENVLLYHYQVMGTAPKRARGQK